MTTKNQKLSTKKSKLSTAKKSKKKPKEPVKLMPEDQRKDKVPKWSYLEEVAYTITTHNFGDLNVRKTANGWWLERQKLEKVIDSKRMDFNAKETCYYSGISENQLEHFLKEHQHFCPYFESLAMHPRTVAKATIVRHLNQMNEAKWYATNRMKEEFAPRSEVVNIDPYEAMTEEEIDAELAKLENE